MFYDVVHDALVKVLSAEERVAAGRLHLEDVLRSPVRDVSAVGRATGEATYLFDLEDGDIEGAASEIVDGDVFPLLPHVRLEAKRESGGSGLVDDALERRVSSGGSDGGDEKAEEWQSGEDD